MNEAFMREAIRLSLESMRAGQGGPFGAVVVRNNEIIGRGWNQVTSANDPTAHAEIVALRAAGRRLGAFRLDECELYSSCEPCPMCLAAAYWAHLKKIYYANTRADAAAIGFDDALIYEEIGRPLEQRSLTLTPCLRDEAMPAFREWQGKTDKVRY